MVGSLAEFACEKVCMMFHNQIGVDNRQLSSCDHLRNNVKGNM